MMSDCILHFLEATGKRSRSPIIGPILLALIILQIGKRGENKRIDVALDVDVKLRNRRPAVFTSYRFLDKVDFFLF